MTDRYFIEAVGKAIDIVEAFEKKGDMLNLNEIASQTGIPRSTTHRILATLESKGWVSRHNENGRYVLGSRLYQRAKIAEPDLVPVARTLMERLAEEFQDTVNLAQWVKNEVLYIYQVEGSHAFRLTSAANRTASFHATALGKAIAAHLNRTALQLILAKYQFEKFTAHTITERPAFEKELASIRKRGYAVDDEEELEGVRCVAVPILIDDTPFAAMSVSGLPKRLPRADIVAKALIKAAREVSRIVSRARKS